MTKLNQITLFLSAVFLLAALISATLNLLQPGLITKNPLYLFLLLTVVWFLIFSLDSRRQALFQTDSDGLLAWSRHFSDGQKPGSLGGRRWAAENEWETKPGGGNEQCE